VILNELDPFFTGVI
jgi:hypothetical protein